MSDWVNIFYHLIIAQKEAEHSEGTSRSSIHRVALVSGEPSMRSHRQNQEHVVAAVYVQNTVSAR